VVEYITERSFVAGWTIFVIVVVSVAVIVIVVVVMSIAASVIVMCVGIRVEEELVRGSGVPSLYRRGVACSYTEVFRA